MTYITGQEIPRTSVAGPDETGQPITVKFLRWTAFGETAYQKGQLAGFSEQHAALLVKRGSATIVSRA